MAGMKHAVIKAGLETLYFSGAHKLARSYLGGIGAILMFHNVKPPRADGFQPNRGLEVTPQFLGDVIKALRSADIDIVSIDEAYRRMIEGGRRRFAVLTFDDGYRDNLEFAYPILKEHGAPFTIYVTSAFASGRGELWWLALEKAVAKNKLIEVDFDSEERPFDCSTLEAKNQAWTTLYWWIRDNPDIAESMRVVREIAFGYGVDMARQCSELCLNWDELRGLAADPLVTIGAHTETHPILKRLTDEQVHREMKGGVDAIEAELGKLPQHFSYPVGDPTSAGAREFRIAGQVGFKTAVTTRPGVLFPEHRKHFVALPRISVNGEFQRLRYLDVLLSGAPTALMNGFRRVDAA